MRSAFLALVVIAGCQSPRPDPVQVRPDNQSVASLPASNNPPPSAPPMNDPLASPIELTLLKRCGAAKPSRITISGLTSSITAVDSGGEARQKSLSAAELTAIAGKLRDAKSIAVKPRAGGAAPACVTTLKGSIEGAPIDLEESASSQVDPTSEAAWKRVIALLEELAASAG